jgi:hypothetical protein
VRLRKYFGKPIWGAVRGRYLLWLAVEGRDRFSVPLNRPVSEIFEMEKKRYQEELSEVTRIVEVFKLEEEAKRRGAWRKKQFVGQNEPPLASEKETATPDSDKPQQPEDAPTRRSIFFRR